MGRIGIVRAVKRRVGIVRAVRARLIRVWKGTVVSVVRRRGNLGIRVVIRIIRISRVTSAETGAVGVLGVDFGRVQFWR